MGKLVVLKFGNGDFKQGFPVVLQIGSEGTCPETEIAGKLPPAPEIPRYYSDWQATYRQLGASSRLEAIAAQATNISYKEDCLYAAQLLHEHLNRWLCSEAFRPLREKWLEKLMPSDVIRVLLQTEDPQLQRLPWHLWDLLERYPNAEIALSTPVYEQVTKRSPPQTKVKILAILGNSAGIDIQTDRIVLEQLPDAVVSFLVEPQCQQLTEHLWEQNWNILFFAGHSSSSDYEKGRIYINQTDSLTIEQLKYGLKKAVAGGLKLAIFNSCDGLGLARELATLHIPQIVVMREPVPDRVAQVFLKYFLQAFAEDKSFYLAVREARERLQGLEDRFPCATLLPVIFQNPAEIPPSWQEWCAKKPQKSSCPVTWHRLKTVLLSSAAIASLLCGGRLLGILQPLELWTFDHLLRLRPPEEADPRLLIVTITEADLQAQSQTDRQGSLSDTALNRLLEKLEQHQPRVVGLDVYRDFPVRPNVQELATRLRQDKRLIGVCKGRDPQSDPAGVPPPPELPQSRLGLSDFIEDTDGVLRRQILFMDSDPASPCTVPYSFSIQVAFHYLQAVGILPQFTEEGNLKLGNTVFESLEDRTGGYQGVDSRGSQILLNYRATSSPSQIAPQVTLSQVLNDQVDPTAIKDRIILIGVTASSAGDYWSTPYGTGPSAKIPGVFIQAHALSQVLSAVLDERSLLWVWPQWGEAFWILIWSAAGGIIVDRFPLPTQLGLAGGATLLTLVIVCYVVLIWGGWMPLVPSGLGFVAAGGMVALSNSKSKK